MSIEVLAGLSGVSASLLSMIENGQRSLTRLSHVAALSQVLGISPLYLAYGDSPGSGPPVAFPVMLDAVTARRHQRLAARLAGLMASGDARAARDWLRRLAREPSVNPWLLLDQLAASARVRTPASGSRPAETAGRGSQRPPRPASAKTALTMRQPGIPAECAEDK
jgi:transcriptional regulator with XRE-family HTH domain